MKSQNARRAAGEPTQFELKGSLFTLTVMHLHGLDLELTRSELEAKIGQAPGFFRNAPVVIDLEAVREGGRSPDFAALAALLREAGLVPVGVRNGGELQAAAVAAGLPLLPESRPQSSRREEAPAKAQAETVSRASRTLTQPVRSGQQVYANDSDLVALATVSNGAEVIADGHIHIYGALRGRALAGASGDTTARIFCQSLEAELVAVAGRYKVIEQLDADSRGKPVQIYLQDEHLVIEPLVK